MTSIIKADNISTVSGSGNITIPTGVKVVGTDTGSIAAPGHVIQTVYAQYAGFTTTATSSWVEYLSSTITPKFATSKILIQSITCYGGVDNSYSAGKCGRTISGGSEVAMRLGDGVDPETRFTDASFGLQMNGSANDIYKMWHTPFNFLDSPTTTNTITYKLYGKADAASRQLRINRHHSYPGDGYNPPPNTTLILTEIAQ